jgi:hypothetical protein
MLAVSLPTAVLAQRPSVIETSVTGTWNSPFPTIQGHSRRNFAILSIRNGWILSKGNTIATYVVDLVPVAVSTNNTYRYDTLPCGSVCALRVPRGKTALGAGIIPLGLQISHKASRAVSLGVEGTAGAIWFDRNFPDPYARRMNFALGVGATMEFDVRKRQGLTLAVLHHHLSNGGTARANPGVNSWMLRVGFASRRETNR